MGYRAPEIFLGLPFSEAIDMWSLGAVMLTLVCGYGPLWTSSKYETIRRIVEWLGAPPDHLLDVGMKTEKYFLREDSGHWRLKTHYEHCVEVIVPKICMLLNSQDGRHLENLLQKNINTVEEDEKSQCINLVKAMLRVDPNERITPTDVLAHPFITRGTLHIGRKEEGRENVEKESESKTLTTGPFEVPPGVILVKPSPTTCILTLDGLESKTFTNETPGTPSAPPSVPFVQAPCESSGAPSAYEECSSVTSGFHGSVSETSPPGVILVQPAPAECCLQGDEDSRQSDSCPVDCLENVCENGPVEPSSLLATDCNVEQELAATTSDGTAPEETQQKKKKRKNCFKRFLAWT
ncbi:homeodomain-interacting protein kinase 2-like [Epinephelus fuscoguttatus]|uniref:homeodomain-interacting protein kinase 2-like n=1 Tax=Epinephelus fuscoguttatus TaxID=293821 RepID=UPI0020D12BFE|nr:homeodomain-interacting protein kinase 2-like [Epinephelus fuscoguttatus]